MPPLFCSTSASPLVRPACRALLTANYCPGPSLFQAIDIGLSTSEIDAKRDTLVLAAQTFSNSSAIRSPTLREVVERGSKILEGLFRAEEARRDRRAAHMLLSAGGTTEGVPEDGTEETFAEVLQRISRSLSSHTERHQGTPPPTRNILSKAASSSFRLPTAFSSTFPPPPRNGGVAGGPDGNGVEQDTLLSPWPFPPLPVENSNELSLQFFQDTLGGAGEEFWANGSAEFLGASSLQGLEGERMGMTGGWEEMQRYEVGGSGGLLDQFGGVAGW